MFCTNYSEIRGKLSELKVSRLAKDGSNKHDFYIPDVIGNHRFAQNYGGYPRSDIAEINAQNDLSIAKAMLESLGDYSSAESNQGVSDAQILLGLQSRYCQAPSEMIRHIESEIDRRALLRRADEVTPSPAPAKDDAKVDPVDNSIG